MLDEDNFKRDKGASSLCCLNANLQILLINDLTYDFILLFLHLNNPLAYSDIISSFESCQNLIQFYKTILRKLVDGCKYIFKRKFNLDDSIDKHKARLVATCFTQKQNNRF